MPQLRGNFTLRIKRIVCYVRRQYSLLYRLQMREYILPSTAFSFFKGFFHSTFDVCHLLILSHLHLLKDAFLRYYHLLPSVSRWTIDAFLRYYNLLPFTATFRVNERLYYYTLIFINIYKPSTKKSQAVNLALVYS